MITTQNSIFLGPTNGDMKTIEADCINKPSKPFVLRNASVSSNKSIVVSDALMRKLANERPNTNNQNW